MQKLNETLMNLERDQRLMQANLDKMMVENGEKSRHLQAIRQKNLWLKKNIAELQSMVKQDYGSPSRTSIKIQRRQKLQIKPIQSTSPVGSSNTYKSRRHNPLEATLHALKLEALKQGRKLSFLENEILEMRNEIDLFFCQVRENCDETGQILQNLYQNMENTLALFENSLEKYEEILLEYFQLKELKDNFNTDKDRAQNQLIKLQNRLTSIKKASNQYARQGLNQRMLKYLESKRAEKVSTQR